MRAVIDTDWGGCKTTRRYISVYIFAVKGSRIFWEPKLQTVVALSSGEAQYVSLSSCVKEVSRLRCLILKLVHRTPCNHESKIPPTAIEIDSSAAM